MRFWLPLMFEPTEQFLDVARWAEELGFEGIALADHLVIPDGFASVHPSGENPFGPETPFQDPLVSLAAMAAVTTRLRFLPYVYILTMREPFSVAKQLATAAMLSNYRVALGCGAGWLAEEITLLGQSFAGRGGRMDEMLDIIADFWDDGWCQFEGQHFHIPRSAMFPVPAEPIPVWIGGKSRRALHRAADHDGWLGMNYDLDEVGVLLAGLADARREAGSDTRSDFEVMVIANALPTVALYADLAGRGVTSTIAMPWAVGDPDYRTLAAKRSAMERFAQEIILPVQAAVGA